MMLLLMIGSERPSRLKGIETNRAVFWTYTIRSCSERPSRLKGIETYFAYRFIYFVDCCSERPSRLKGIETHCLFHIRLCSRSFGKTFPFEGNWNIIKGGFAFSLNMFGKTFPFEGNWNSLPLPVFLLTLTEFGKTFPFEGNWNTMGPPMTKSQNRNPFRSERPSRLKGIETMILSFFIFSSPKSSERPSRLKGIETKQYDEYFQRILMFGKTFPFEGNWNFFRRRQQLQLPRSERPSRLKGIETLCHQFHQHHLHQVRKDLPVWRELKHGGATILSSDMRTQFGKTFPFEGNWNSDIESCVAPLG